MPTYDYKCMKCDHHFEHFQSMSDLPLTVCPLCGSTIRRLVSGGSGLIFKGKGVKRYLEKVNVWLKSHQNEASFYKY